MRPLFSFLLLCFLSVNAKAQSRANKYVSLAAFSAQNAKPFGKFAGLFDETFHPGIQATYGRNISMGQNHDWFLELKLGYFYHRYVQHAIPFYLNFGYRYKITDHFSAETSLGAGYMHSISATAQLKLDSNGDYVKSKGAGRMQAMAMFSLGIGYTLNPHSARPIKIFTAYQQMVQMPFVRSYVPLLPYNTFIIGVCRNLKSKR
ncbi:MAG: hypothetical protein E6H10_18220 [Bacteroidetes bacterium]|nr:MAG: hypothetical protein E6H10_18220 [Bacteroidota bacterium]